MRCLVVGVAVCLFGALAVPVVHADPLDDRPAPIVTSQRVCTDSVPGPSVCAVAGIDSAIDECFYTNAGAYYCDLTSRVQVAVEAAPGSGRVRGFATSQAVNGSVVEAGPGEVVTGPRVLVRHNALLDDGRMPDGGTTVVYHSQVCIQVLTPDGEGASDPVCKAWPHAFFIPDDGTCCSDPVVEWTFGIQFADWFTRNAAASSGALDYDRSSEHVCGINTRVDIGCGSARLLHSEPACSGPAGSRECAVEYWLEMVYRPGFGCMRAGTDQFVDLSVHCVDEFVGTAGLTSATFGPFAVTYSDVPSDGHDVDVWANVCLGNGDPQYGLGNSRKGVTHCTVWSPATIHLPGA